MLINSLLRLRAIDDGFDPNGVLVARVAAPPVGNEREASFFDELRLRTAALPGVTTVGTASAIIRRRNPDLDIKAEGGSSSTDVRIPLGDEIVSRGYLQAVGARLLHGHFFDERDTGPHTSVVINEALARHFFGSTNVVGKRISYYDDDTWSEVIGVIANQRRSTIESDRFPSTIISAAPPKWSSPCVDQLTHCSSPNQFGGSYRSSIPAPS